jgi:hypothetical protein
VSQAALGAPDGYATAAARRKEATRRIMNETMANIWYSEGDVRGGVTNDCVNNGSKTEWSQWTVITVYFSVA